MPEIKQVSDYLQLSGQRVEVNTMYRPAYEQAITWRSPEEQTEITAVFRPGKSYTISYEGIVSDLSDDCRYLILKDFKFKVCGSLIPSLPADCGAIIAQDKIRLPLKSIGFVDVLDKCPSCKH